MKRTLQILLAVVLVSAGIVSSFAADKPSVAKVFAYYFHGDFRCPTCLKLEMYSREAIAENFKDALASGKIEFKAVNVDRREDRHFIKDYQLYSKSLVLSLVRDGKEVRSKNLTRIWEYVYDKKKFFEYVKQETEDFLKGL